MPRKNPTPRQAEILTLLREDKSVAEIAKHLKTSAQAIYAQISRMRKDGILPKAGRRKRGGTRTGSDATPAPTPAPTPNGHEPDALVSVEEHLAAEHRAVQTRLDSIGQEKAALESEEVALTARAEQLAAAEAAFRPQGQPPLAAVS